MPDCPDDPLPAFGFHLKSIENPFCYFSPDRMVAMDQGRVIAAGDPQAVLHHPDVVASYLGTDEAVIARSG